MACRHASGYLLGTFLPRLAQTVVHVVKKTEELGFEIVRLVTDNHKTNVAAMDILSKRTAKISAPHPADPSRRLYLAFDQSHIIKNVRSQFLAKDICGKKEISSASLKELYKMQRGSTVKRIRYLTRKHLYPSNIEMSETCSANLLSASYCCTPVSERPGWPHL